MRYVAVEWVAAKYVVNRDLSCGSYLLTRLLQNILCNCGRLLGRYQLTEFLQNIVCNCGRLLGRYQVTEFLQNILCNCGRLLGRYQVTELLQNMLFDCDRSCWTSCYIIYCVIVVARSALVAKEYTYCLIFIVHPVSMHIL